jgi:hypothetical protein
LTITNSGTYKLVFDTTGVANNKIIAIAPLGMSATGGPVIISTYRISSYSNGTIYPTGYLNTTKIIPAGTVVKRGITSSDSAGNDLREYLLGATGNPQQVSRAGSAGGSVPLVLSPGIVICLEIDNNYSGDVQLGLDLVWYEYPIS